MKVLAIVLILLTLFVAVAPQAAANNLSSVDVPLPPARVTPVRYQFVAAAEIVAAMPLIASALVLYFGRRKDMTIFASFLGIILGFLISLVPIVLMRSCSLALSCGMVRSALIVSGSLVMIVNLSILVVSLQRPVRVLG